MHQSLDAWVTAPEWSVEVIKRLADVKQAFAMQQTRLVNDVADALGESIVKVWGTM